MPRCKLFRGPPKNVKLWKIVGRFSTGNLMIKYAYQNMNKFSAVYFRRDKSNPNLQYVLYAKTSLF